MTYLGVILILVGLAIRVVAMRTLGPDFTLALRTPSRIVRSGIYRYVRHPSYWGSIIALGGASLLSPVAGILWLAYMFFRARIAEEEKYLSFHPDYKR